MTRKDWFIETIRLTEAARKYGETSVHYPYHVTGHYSQECSQNGRETTFSWTLPMKFWDNQRYDLTGVTIDERTVNAGLELAR